VSVIARVQIPFSVETQVEVSSQKLVAPVIGATISVKNRDTGGSVSIFATETGSSTIPSPVTDANGNVPGWLPEGSYTITVSGGSPAISPIERAWDAVRGDGVSIVAPSVIIPSMLAATTTALLVPTGTILSFASALLPGGYLWATGQAVSRTTYSALYGALGTTFGSGNGSTTFNVPDLRGRAPVGADNFGGAGSANRLHAQTFSSDGVVNQNTVGGTGGQDSHVLSTGELASHTHSPTDPGHSHTGSPNFLNEAGGGPSGFTVGSPSIAINSQHTTSSSTTGISLANTGSNIAHNTMSPYQACFFIIKT